MKYVNNLKKVKEIHQINERISQWKVRIIWWHCIVFLSIENTISKMWTVKKCVNLYICISWNCLFVYTFLSSHRQIHKSWPADFRLDLQLNFSPVGPNVLLTFSHLAMTIPQLSKVPDSWRFGQHFQINCIDL